MLTANFQLLYMSIVLLAPALALEAGMYLHFILHEDIQYEPYMTLWLGTHLAEYSWTISTEYLCYVFSQ